MYDRFDNSKKFTNLAAINCFATIYGANPYEKTYQDRLDVSNLVDDEKPLNLDKFFAVNEANRAASTVP